MVMCTAPVRGHRTASGAANCPACSGRYYGYRNSSNYYSRPYSNSSNYSWNKSSKSRPSWSPANSSVVYTPAEIRALRPARQSIEKRASLPDRRDVFLCHAWDDRKGTARELRDLLESKGVSVWFSEKDVALGDRK